MHHFEYRSGILHCEGVSLETIAAELGTPAYVYSDATFRRHYNVLAEAFTGRDHLIAYAVKANSNLAVLATMAKLGAGADVVSGGEMWKAMHAGIPADKIVFSGVGKTDDEIRLGLSSSIHQFNVESLPELQRISRVATEMGKTAPVAFRVNPNVEAGGHAHISTGAAEHKFGIAWHEAEAAFKSARDLPGVNPVGITVHIGSQILDVTPFKEAWTKVLNLAKSLREDGYEITRLDFGGGLGIPYTSGENPDTPAKYADTAREVLGNFDAQLIIEPGRVIAGNAGILIARVEYVKERDNRKFVILDTAMNDLMRPALYAAHHDILPIKAPPEGTKEEIVDLVGPICESTDRFAKDRSLPPLKEGDLIAFMSAGAYGAVLASQYNSRPLVAEAMVRGDTWETVRERPSYEDLVTRERTPGWLENG